MEEEEKKEGDMLTFIRDIEVSWKSQETKPGLLNGRCGQFAIFRPGVQRKLILNQSPKWS